VQEAGWEPQYDLAGGIRQTIEWWRSPIGKSAGGSIPHAEE
jgi:nucleoside-diphosphate-sugar epimerase